MIELIIEMTIGLLAAAIYPKMLRLIRIKFKNTTAYILAFIFFILGLLTGVGFILLWFLILFLIIKKFVNQEYENWKISSSIYGVYLFRLLFIYKILPKSINLGSIIFILAIFWLVEDYNFEEFKNAGLTFGGGMVFVQVLTLILSSLLGVEPSILKLM
ncbi:hypothetical protein [Natroniella sp. ANB-PHB2]|uniref:hypothetical protein n=1 Tax=Natroniella sp. ANB-PHB2 TaxID=3384444 RepID=UPI0038D4D7DC